MRVLFLVTDDWFFWSHRLGLARAVRDAGGSVVVATCAGPLQEAIEAEGFAFEPVRFGRDVLGQLANLALVRRLERLYRRLRPDIAHHVSFLPIVYGSLAARRAGVPAVVNAVTGLGRFFMEEGGRRGPARRLVERAYRRALVPSPGGPRSLALFQNPDDERLFRELGLVRPAEAALVHGSGVDTARFRPSDERPGVPVVLFCSRMLHSKGVADLVEACALLRARGVPHALELAGEPHGDNPDSLRERDLARWHERGLARWLGRRDDVPELLARSHVVALPSYYREGVPLALIEAAASARALVTTDTPGCREIVRHGVNGLLVPPRRPPELAQALAALLEDPATRARMGAAGRALVLERFSAAVVNGAILEHYRRLLGEGARAPRPARAGAEPPPLLPAAHPLSARRGASG